MNELVLVKFALDGVQINASIFYGVFQVRVFGVRQFVADSEKVLDGRPMSFLEADIFILQASAFCAIHHNLP
jgi:hypothetical protein